jgi:stage II sporulation protein AA (anti-sigma F factor antagonist)
MEINGEFIKICKLIKGGIKVSMQCKIINRNLVVNVSEELDHHNAEIIRDKIDKLIVKNNIKCVIFDFSNTNFMDSSGIGVIMGRYKNIKNMGGNVVVTNINKRMDRIFKISGLYRIIKNYDNVDLALKDISNIG